MSKIKFFIGPMSKNVVDSAIEFATETGNLIGLIPSRRQVAMGGGYVNNWTTSEFADYAQSLFLTRDHGGPNQGLSEDDGYDSLKVDCGALNMIHIDPWKAFPRFDDGLLWTLNMIRYCYKLNPEMLYEIGTEQSIRKFTSQEVYLLIKSLKRGLTSEQFEQIKYCVIQSGTSLKENHNTGVYDKQRLLRMVQVTRDYGLLSKEHNGDYLPEELIKEKFDLGLDSINIAPEFGQLETKTYLKKIKDSHGFLFEDFWRICYESGRWKKWVNSSFDPTTQKEELVNICGHYVLSQPNFLEQIKSQLDNVDRLVRKSVKSKLESLYGC
jgi:hypothetical protein